LDLTASVQKKEFKEDLYYRLRVVTIHVPPLRERLSDIPELVKHFLQKINNDLQTEVTKLQNGVIDRLMTHTWTGNVRELENCLVEAVVRARGNVILLEDIKTILNTDSGLDSEGLSGYSLPRMEKEHIEKTLRHLDWNRTRSAEVLGITLPTLRSKIRKYHIIVPSLRW